MTKPFEKKATKEYADSYQKIQKLRSVIHKNSVELALILSDFSERCLWQHAQPAYKDMRSWVKQELNWGWAEYCNFVDFYQYFYYGERICSEEQAIRIPRKIVHSLVTALDKDVISLTTAKKIFGECGFNFSEIIEGINAKRKKKTTKLQRVVLKLCVKEFNEYHETMSLFGYETGDTKPALMKALRAARKSVK